jgi:hypothetical protein
MTRRNDRHGERIDCKHLALMLLLSLGLALSFSLITATASLACGECTCGRVFGAGEWYSPGWVGEDPWPPIVLPPDSGRTLFYFKEDCHNRPPRGWLYSNSEAFDYWALYSASVEDGAVQIVSGIWSVLRTDESVEQVEGDVAWLLVQIVKSSDDATVGMWAVAAAYDGGRPGSNGDVLFLTFPTSKEEAEGIYRLGVGGIQITPLLATMVSGGCVIR